MSAVSNNNSPRCTPCRYVENVVRPIGEYGYFVATKVLELGSFLKARVVGGAQNHRVVEIVDTSGDDERSSVKKSKTIAKKVVGKKPTNLSRRRSVKPSPASEKPKEITEQVKPTASEKTVAPSKPKKIKTEQKPHSIPVKLSASTSAQAATSEKKPAENSQPKKAKPTSEQKPTVLPVTSTPSSVKPKTISLPKPPTIQRSVPKDSEQKDPPQPQTYADVAAVGVARSVEESPLQQIAASLCNDEFPSKFGLSPHVMRWETLDELGSIADFHDPKDMPKGGIPYNCMNRKQLQIQRDFHLLVNIERFVSESVLVQKYSFQDRTYTRHTTTPRRHLKFYAQALTSDGEIYFGSIEVTIIKTTGEVGHANFVPDSPPRPAEEGEDNDSSAPFSVGTKVNRDGIDTKDVFIMRKETNEGPVKFYIYPIEMTRISLPEILHIPLTSSRNTQYNTVIVK